MGAIASPLAALGSIAGATLPVLSTANSLVSQVKNFGNNVSSSQLRKEQDLALKQLQARQNLDAQQSAAQTELERARLNADAASAESARRDALRRAVARQKAQFGASGVGSGSGSSEAVLLGLFDESEDERTERERLDSLRSSALDLSLSNQGSMNVLQRTQLQLRQKLEREMQNAKYLF